LSGEYCFVDIEKIDEISFKIGASVFWESAEEVSRGHFRTCSILVNDVEIEGLKIIVNVTELDIEF
jgi:hypothetical protein